MIRLEAQRGNPGALIFCHHLSAYAENGAGFIDVSAQVWQQLKASSISFYHCHAPLDCHPSVSTGNALANALGLSHQRRFGAYKGGLAGIIGEVETLPFQAFATRLAQVCELPALRYDQLRHQGQPVHRIAVIPGGGGDPEFIQEAQDLQADTYVTGHWHLFMETPFGASHRQEMQAYLPSVSMNLLGTAHYSSEWLVMRDQMPCWFAQYGMETYPLRQNDPWGAV